MQIVLGSMDTVLGGKATPKPFFLLECLFLRVLGNWWYQTNVELQ
jgi:hypothetical protein